MTSSTPNYSIHSIPAFFMLNMFPHAYSIYLISSSTAKKWDNRNPRGSAHTQSLEKSLPPPIYAKYERARACHYNGFEQMPLFFTAVVLGNMAGLENQTMNYFGGALLGLRILYTFAYITTETRRYSFVRTLIWISSLSSCLWIMVKAGRVISAKSV